MEQIWSGPHTLFLAQKYNMARISYCTKKEIIQQPMEREMLRASRKFLRRMEYIRWIYQRMHLMMTHDRFIPQYALQLYHRMHLKPVPSLILRLMKGVMVKSVRWEWHMGRWLWYPCMQYFTYQSWNQYGISGPQKTGFRQFRQITAIYWRKIWVQIATNMYMHKWHDI